jgi:mono/diheme cytochrome c family protein
MGVRWVLGLAAVLFVALVVSRSAPQAAEVKPAHDPASAQADQVEFKEKIVPLLAKYCLSCHSGDNPRADLALDIYKDAAAVIKHRKVWEKVAHNVRSREMPPKERKLKPTEAEIELLTTWIDNQLAKVNCDGPRDPGRVTIRRLNKAEYNNTIRDLVGIDFKPADDFPSDDVGYGFDNIGDVLSMPPILMEKYLAAAEQIVERAWKSPEAKKRIMIADISGRGRREAARRIVETFARRAYRRPVTKDEVDRLMGLVELAERNGDGTETGIQLAVQAVLISPHFLFRIERDPEPNNPKAVHLISEHELAVRLSYFLWSSMPDDELFKLAEEGKLRQPGVLEGQVKRMLADPKAKALVKNFAGQWLQLRSLEAATPDPALFPTFNDKLRQDMLTETELFFEAVMREDRSVLDFLDADYTFVNERLAKHYGIEGVTGEEFRRVKLTGERGGVLTQASVLTVTSNPTRTSPVKRGKFILENILGTPPPPPAPDAGELSEDKEVVEAAPLRVRLEQHRANPNCATCHQKMDPLGFALENFDAVGAWRTKDGKFPIDSTGVLPDGKSFKGPRELRAVLKGKAGDFHRCLTEKLLTYALGRGLEYYDKCAVDDLVKQLAKDDRFSVLVLAVVTSDPFQKRRGKGGG